MGFFLVKSARPRADHSQSQLLRTEYTVGYLLYDHRRRSTIAGDWEKSFGKSQQKKVLGGYVVMLKSKYARRNADPRRHLPSTFAVCLFIALAFFSAKWVSVASAQSVLPRSIALSIENAARLDPDTYQALISVVVTTIAENPHLTEAVIAKAAELAPRGLDRLLAVTTRHFPGHADRIRKGANYSGPVEQPFKNTADTKPFSYP